MVTVRRQNVILQIDEEDVEKYVEKGFSVLDKYGNIIRASMPTDVGSLQKAFSDQQKLIEQKDNEIKELKAQIEVLLGGFNQQPEKPKSTSTYRKKKQQ